MGKDETADERGRAIEWLREVSNTDRFAGHTRYAAARVGFRGMS